MAIDTYLKRLDEEGLGEFFSASAVQRAQAYISRVENLDAAGNTLKARVQGTDAEPYTVRVKLEMREFLGQRSLDIATRCSCPVVNRCKHAAAVIMAARRRGALTDKPRPEILSWARNLRERIDEQQQRSHHRVSRDALFYVFRSAAHWPDIELQLVKARCDSDGQPSGASSEWTHYEQALLKPPGFVREEDLHILRLYRSLTRQAGVFGLPRLTGSEGFVLAEAALASGRACLRSGRGRLLPLTLGEDRAATLEWQTREDGVGAAVLSDPPCEHVARTTPMLYFDGARNEAGRLLLGDDAVAAELLALPALSRAELPVVAGALSDVAPAMPSPLALSEQPLAELVAPCVPVLTVSTLSCWSWRAHRGYARREEGLEGDQLPGYDYALPAFCYGEARLVVASKGGIATLADGRAVEVKRDHEAEARALEAFEAVGFRAIRSGWVSTARNLPAGLYGLDSEAHWTRFFGEVVPALQAAGWVIECPQDFRHRMLLPSAWHAAIEEDDGGWFGVSLGVDVDGQRIDLAPLLHAAFHNDPRWLDARTIGTIGDEEAMVVQLEDGTRVGLPAARLKPLARTLIDLFDRPGRALQLSALDAPRLADAFDAMGDDWRATGLEALESWLERLRTVGKVEPVAPPEGLAVALRPYQLEGLSWLQHLRAHGLGGILADDMGLGKTAQALAHLLVEKHAGRLDRPALVVLPTSLIFNWQQEAQRFAPELKVLKLRGSDRAQAFARIPEHDICLTTYPLLWRDHEALAEHHYHSLILDEAQTVKNAASKAAKAVRSLRADHRLCITGTPLENHLGELWAQFDFLLPGFLGDHKDFNARWRTPIEKRGDVVRRELLARRIAPFMLRRRKEDVAQELPPKSVVLRTVELDGRQRDLYETVRATMDKRVRDEVAARGFARSQIVILDALLKLRQVCCDPRLLRTDAARGVKERAKLELLMDILPELVDEGRRILLFSQFTTMLGLIEAELKKRHIDHLVLTGATRDRESPVRRFQRGEVPVFLISLKAGGVGLNLTAADTVIHYDPWWNPAVENQATDRAHRIGQDKPVFVYKLVVAGSIEEKILALQDKKAALAAGILSDDREGVVKFGEDDLSALFAPLPEPAAQ